MHTGFSIRWVVALQAEANPIITEFKLKLVHHLRPFKVFRNVSRTHWLIISGVGTINVAAASAYLHNCSNANFSSFWFNVGVAGYANEPLGELFLIDSILDEITEKKHFPRTYFSRKIKKGNLFTTLKPQKNYKDGYMIDMEGYPFFDVINRFALREMIAVIKVVSDNKYNAKSNIKKNLVNGLISKNLPLLKYLVAEAELLSQNETDRLAPKKIFNKIPASINFTRTQTIMVGNLIKDWEVAFHGRSVLKEIQDLKSAKMIIKKLKDDLSFFKIDWLTYG